jgi:hypothetical protein
VRGAISGSPEPRTDRFSRPEATKTPYIRSSIYLPLMDIYSHMYRSHLAWKHPFLSFFHLCFQLQHLRQKRTCIINTDGGNGVEPVAAHTFVCGRIAAESIKGTILTCLFLFPCCVFGLGVIIDGVHHSGKNGSGRIFLFFAYGRNMYSIAG